MAPLNLYGLFRQARRLAGPQTIGVPSDGELIERVISLRDEAAFEVIVWRHGPMVFSVCRRLLRNEHDAEDAFQATFLTLVRKAGSIHRHQALGSWLHKVAHRVALRAREMAARRAALEKQQTVISPAVSHAVSVELKEVLDAELKRLPERYRVAVVLCYLQGRTTDEAARELGCPRGTVLSRLARARERLRGRLVRRGLTLSAGTFAAALSETAAPAMVPAALVEATVRTELGGGTAAIAAPVVALTKGVLHTMLINRLKIIAGVTLAVGTVAGAGLLTHQALAERAPVAPAQGAAAETPNPPQKTTAAPVKPKWQTRPITVTGTAVDADGKPVKDATIYLLSTNRIDAVLGSTKTDGDGRYAFKDAPLPVDRPNTPQAHLGGTFQVYGTAPGCGFAWHGMRFFNVQARPADWNPAGEDHSYFLDEPLVMNLEFRPAAKLHGRIVDETDKPIKGAKVTIRNADYFDVQGKEKHINFREFWGINLLPAKLKSAYTNETGHFQLDGLPPEGCFWVWVEHAAYASLSLYAVTTDRTVTERDYEGRKQVVHSGTLNLNLLRPRRIMLQVVYDDTGKPAPGIRVGMSGSGADAVGYWAHGTTNAQGKLLLKLPPGEYPITADPKGDVPYIRTQQTLSVSKTPEEQPYELRMNPGCVLILEAVDEATGKGVAQVPFGYSTEGDPDLWMSVYGDTGRIADHHTDANGRVRVVLAPGKRNFKVGWGTLPADYEAVSSDEDIRGPGTRVVDLPAGGTVMVKFKLRKK